jgi:hypothetical protein
VDIAGSVMPMQKIETVDMPRSEALAGPQFIPKLRGKKVIIWLVSGGQPITGIVEGYNPSPAPNA